MFKRNRFNWFRKLLRSILKMIPSHLRLFLGIKLRRVKKKEPVSGSLVKEP